MVVLINIASRQASSPRIALYQSPLLLYPAGYSSLTTTSHCLLRMALSVEPDASLPNGSKTPTEQYRPEINRIPQGDFMRPATRTRGTSNAKTNGVGVQVEDTRICVVMVGLPARGKSLIAQKGEFASSHNDPCTHSTHHLY